MGELIQMRGGRKTADMWINEAITDPDKDGKCSMISLVHMVGQQEKEIHTTKFGGGKDWKAIDLAAMFMDKARTYCQDIHGLQTFQLLAFYDGRTTPQAFFPFTVNSENTTGALGTEAPTETGRTQQLMRQGEMLFQQTYRRQQVQDEFMTRLISMQSTMIKELSQENRDAFGIVKEMLMQKALDDHNRAMEQLKFQRETAERKKWMGWAPPLLNTILGKEIFPQSTADTALVEGIADSLTEEDIMKIAGVLKPEVWGPLAHRMHAYMQKRNLEEEQIKALSAVRSPDPESDAAGDVVQLNGKA